MAVGPFPSTMAMLAVAAVIAAPRPAAGSVVVADPAAATTDAVLSRGRTADHLAHPELLGSVLAYCESDRTSDCMWRDPYRLDWDRGRVADVELVDERGTRRGTRVYAPFGRGPFPAAVLSPGMGSDEQMYWGMTHGLVEAGYVVLAFSEPCVGGSECPDEGESEGPLPPAPVPPTEDLAQGFIGCRADASGCNEWTQEAYEEFGPLAISTTRRAVDALLSDANPFRHLVDDGRVGIVGHSLGAYAAGVVANQDARVDAAVTWDAHGYVSRAVDPRVPTMFQIAEMYSVVGPFVTDEDPDRWPGSTDAAVWATAGVPTAVIVPRASSHNEWHWMEPHVAAASVAAVQTALGERIGLYYTRAWLDAFVKHGAGGREGRARLTRPRFDGSVDASSIGAGRFDAVTRSNAPYVLEGLSVPDHLSQVFRSWVSAPTIRCDDLVAGC